MDFRLFGQVRLWQDGEWRSDWQHAKIRGMLGVLLARQGKIVPVTELVEWLWGPAADPVSHAKRLHTYVSKLRRVVENLPEPVWVKHVSAGYRLAVEPERIDYHRARSLLDRAQRATKQADHDKVCELLTEVLALCDEQPLIELETDLAEAFRRTTERGLVLPAYYTLLESQLTLGFPERVISTLDEVQLRHELNVTLAKLRIDALRAADRDQEATQYFLHTYRLLQEHDYLDEADELRRYSDRQSSEIPTQSAASFGAVRIVPRRMPHDLRTFRGREEILSELDARTDHGGNAAIVVLTGTAGIGKTALAVHWAYRVRDRFQDGYIYTDLQGFSSAPRLATTDLVRVLLQAFEVSADRLGDEQAQWARLSTLIGHRHTLFILDNVADVDQIIPLVDMAPDSVLVVTSRRHLDHLTLHCGAREIHVHTMDRNTSENLLYEGVGERSELEPTAFTELVDLCAGIPLALRIVGHYADKRPDVALIEIAQFLRNEHQILGVGESTNRPEYSIRASFTLSYSALPPSAMRLFRLLGLCPIAEIELGAAAALVGSPRRVVLRDMDVLVDHHLIEQTTGHYQLHDLLHQFATELAESEEQPTARRKAIGRLLDWHVHTANNAERHLYPFRDGVPMLPVGGGVEPAEFHDDQEALLWFMRERTALLAAVRMAVANGFHGHAWRLPNVINEPLKRQGYYQHALDSLLLGLQGARIVGDKFGESVSLNNLGYISLNTRAGHSAYEYFSAACQMWRDLDHEMSPLGIAIAMHNMACQRMLIGDLDAADGYFLETLDFETEHRLDHARAGTLRRFGELRRAQGDYGDARRRYYESLEFHEKVGDQHGYGGVCTDLGQLYLEIAEYQAAIDFGGRAVTRHERSKDAVSLAETFCILADAYSRQQRYDHAIDCAEQAIRWSQRTQIAATEARALDLVGTALNAAGRRHEAVQSWIRARDLYHRLGDDQMFAILHERLTSFGAA